MTDIHLNFLGPFTFTAGDASVFECAVASCPGIYLWTIRQSIDGSRLVHYVGETTSLGDRHREHPTYILGPNYGILDADKARQGVCVLLWKGLWRDKSQSASLGQMVAYEAVHKHVLRYVSAIDIFFAEFHGERQLRRHIEGCDCSNFGKTGHPWGASPGQTLSTRPEWGTIRKKSVFS
jgi:hypothetical protein